MTRTISCGLAPRTLFRDVSDTYAAAWLVGRAGWPLVAALVAVEGAQHVVEWQRGIYAGDAFGPAGDAAFWTAATAKVVTVTLVALVGARLVATDGAFRPALLPPPSLALRIAAGLTVTLAVTVMPLAQAAVPPEVLPVAEASARVLLERVAQLGLVLNGLVVFLVPWLVAWLVGDRTLPLRRSATWAAWRTPWVIVVGLAAYAPLFTAHVGLGLGAVGRPPALAAVMLAVDSLVVGALACMMGAFLWITYDRARSDLAG